MTLRRSTRLKTISKNDDVVSEPQDGQSDAPEITLLKPQAPPMGRKRKAAEVDVDTREQVAAFNSKKAKMKKGYLQQVAEMPIDVVFEVCLLLSMNFHSVAKPFEDFWQARSARPVTSLANVQGFERDPDFKAVHLCLEGRTSQR